MALIKFTLLIPIRFNDGANVPQSLLEEILDELYDLAKGWSHAGTVTGAYQMHDGSKQLDESMCVWVCVRRNQVAALKRLIGEIGSKLDQEFMFLEESGGKLNFVPPARKRKVDDDGKKKG